MLKFNLQINRVNSGLNYNKKQVLLARSSLKHLTLKVMHPKKLSLFNLSFKYLYVKKNCILKHTTHIDSSVGWYIIKKRINYVH